MKVCTDACLFAGYVANELTGHEQKILDAGTGTGLLSLMIAQQTDALVDALEIDEMAVAQAITNVSQSPWPQQVQVHHADFLAFTTAKKYDLIMSCLLYTSDTPGKCIWHRARPNDYTTYQVCSRTILFPS